MVMVRSCLKIALEMNSALSRQVEFHAQFFQQRVLPQLPSRILSPGGDRAVIGGGKDVLCFVVGQVRGEMRGRAIHHADIAVVQAIPVGVFTFRQWREARGRAVIRAAERVGIVELYQVTAQAVEHAPLRRELHPMFEEYSGVLQIRIDGTVQESRDRISIGARGSLKTSRKPPLRMIEGSIEEKVSGPGLPRCRKNPRVGVLGQIEDAHRLVDEGLDIEHMSIAVRKAAIDVVVH